MNRDIGNIVAGAVLLTGSVGLWIYTVAAHYRMGNQIAYDAGLVPRLWLAIGAAAAAAMVVKGVWGLAAHRATPPLAAIGPVRLAVAFVFLVAFVSSFNLLGYWVTMLVFIPAFSLAFGYRNPIVIGATTVGFATLTWLVFVNLLLVQMQALPPFM